MKTWPLLMFSFNVSKIHHVYLKSKGKKGILGNINSGYKMLIIKELLIKAGRDA